ncbi:hypothetical protein SteCoe_11586 [Stentor coeruleus]|uniref:Uncharacterized protein n=1 Tax=Stentor coeruleus TaxID=5963 RepID=A0A1R2CCR4_9CILI|nr:hypothetical protein SteCoe_11586 [Stentor coeruleus]
MSSSEDLPRKRIREDSEKVPKLKKKGQVFLVTGLREHLSVFPPQYVLPINKCIPTLSPLGIRFFNTDPCNFPGDSLITHKYGSLNKPTFSSISDYQAIIQDYMYYGYSHFSYVCSEINANSKISIDEVIETILLYIKKIIKVLDKASKKITLCLKIDNNYKKAIDGLHKGIALLYPYLEKAFSGFRSNSSAGIEKSEESFRAILAFYIANHFIVYEDYEDTLTSKQIPLIEKFIADCFQGIKSSKASLKLFLLEKWCGQFQKPSLKFTEIIKNPIIKAPTTSLTQDIKNCYKKHIPFFQKIFHKEIITKVLLDLIGKADYSLFIITYLKNIIIPDFLFQGTHTTCTSKVFISMDALTLDITFNQNLCVASFIVCLLDEVASYYTIVKSKNLGERFLKSTRALGDNIRDMTCKYEVLGSNIRSERINDELAKFLVNEKNWEEKKVFFKIRIATLEKGIDSNEKNMIK